MSHRFVDYVQRIPDDHLCSLRYFSRRADFKNFPTEVLGIASITSYPPGIQNFGNLAPRNSFSSKGEKSFPFLSTIYANGRSIHFSSGMPITAASDIEG